MCGVGGEGRGGRWVGCGGRGAGGGRGVVGVWLEAADERGAMRYEVGRGGRWGVGEVGVARAASGRALCEVRVWVQDGCG